MSEATFKQKLEVIEEQEDLIAEEKAQEEVCTSKTEGARIHSRLIIVFTLLVHSN